MNNSYEKTGEDYFCGGKKKSGIGELRILIHNFN